MYHDTTTIFVFGAILLTFVGLLQVWLWEQDRRSHELGLWGVAHLLGGFGLALLVGRGLLPNRLSIDLGNAAIDLGGGLAWIGVPAVRTPAGADFRRVRRRDLLADRVPVRQFP